MDKSLENLKNKSKKAYEISRLKSSLWPIGAAIGFAMLGGWLCSSLTLASCIAFVIGVFSILFLWRGQSFGKAVIPSMILGFTGLLIPSVTHFFGVCCRYDIEIYICVGTGVLLGIIHGYAPARNPKLGWQYLVSGIVIIGLAGVIGCSYLGTAGIIGVLCGTVAASVSSYLILKVKS